MILELLTTIIGVTAGIFALAGVFISLRSIHTGYTAFQVNRDSSYKNSFKNFQGKMLPSSQVSYSRAQLGLAINLKSKKLERQQRLSEEAVDDVIAAKV